MFGYLLAGAIGYALATPTGKKMANKFGDMAFGAVKNGVDKAVKKYKVTGEKKNEDESYVSTPTEK